MAKEQQEIYGQQVEESTDNGLSLRDILEIGLANWKWFALSVIFAGFQVDITERYKYIIYCVSGITALTLLALSDFFLGFLGFFENSALKFVEQYAIANVFVMLMAYFHWPYEVLHDQNYLGGDEAAQATMPADFFVNNDSDQEEN